MFCVYLYKQNPRGSLDSARLGSESFIGVVGPFKTEEPADDVINDLHMMNTGFRGEKQPLHSIGELYGILNEHPVMKPCPVCNGTGRDPMSDNTHWLPCPECLGTRR